MLLKSIMCTILAAFVYTSKSNRVKPNYNELDDHTLVTDSDVFPYVAAILKKTTYLSAGALIGEEWVLTAADSLYLLKDSARFLRVRLGSINHRKGGVLVRIKYFEIHPYFDDYKPEYDLALLRLSRRLQLTPSLNPIRIQKKARQLTATHFLVTTWPGLDVNSSDVSKLESIELIKRRRLLSKTHLHPTNPEKCTEYLDELVVSAANLMCLDLPLGTDPCVRNAGAPVVLNGVLWGITSSWKPEDCDVDKAPSYVSLVAAPNITTWIHATLTGKKWTRNRAMLELIDYDAEYDSDL